MPAMRIMRRDTRLVFAAMLVFVLAGCSGQKDAAHSLVLEIAATVAAAAPEASKYVPEQLEDIQAKLAALQASFDKKDYDRVVAAAPEVLAAAQLLATDAAAKKDRILKEQNDSWTNLVAVLPDEVTALQSRVDLLEKKPAKKQAKDVDRAAAGASMADITSLWSKAQAAFAGGNLEEAVATAKDVKSKADALAVALKMNPAPASGAT